jgi:hypothetical protein
MKKSIKRKYRNKKSKRKSRKKSKKVQPSPYIYCGNNALHPDLANGRAVIGTKHRCLKKGFGAGYYSPVDLNFLNEYRPIDNRKVYCGNQENVPEGYDRHGNLPSCFQKGFASGKRKKAMEN